MNILLKIILVVAIIAVVIYGCQFFAPTKFIYDGAVYACTQVVSFVQQYTGIAVAAAGGLIVPAIAYLKKIASIKQAAEAQINDVKSSLNTVSSQAQGEINTLTDQTKTLSSTNVDLQKRLDEMTIKCAEAEKFNEDGVGIVTQLKSQLTNKESEISALQQLLKEYKVTEKIVVK